MSLIPPRTESVRATRRASSPAPFLWLSPPVADTWGSARFAFLIYIGAAPLQSIGSQSLRLPSVRRSAPRRARVKTRSEPQPSQKISYLRHMEFIIPSIDRIGETARRFADAAHFDDKRRNVFAFYGKMGAGKTTFIKALCDVLGVDDVVNSPTFAIVNEYHSNVLNGPVFHFDFYRIKHVDEAFDIGTDDYFYSGAPCFIEWPELIEPLLPDNAVRVDIDELPDGTRRVTLAE